ncbi:hypothetical protein ASG47_18715 [Devosia sp. Leaf420]|nr:hypothetical protein ASG47_18715 [Devosia sp. Leaf420]
MHFLADRTLRDNLKGEILLKSGRHEAEDGQVRTSSLRLLPSRGQFSRLKRLLFLVFHAYIRTAFEVNCLMRFYFGLQRQKGRTASKKRDADVDQ